MAENKINITVQDGSLGLAASSGKTTSVKMGVATNVPTLIGSVTATGTPPTLTPSGVAIGDYNIKVVVDGSGNEGVGTFKWSKDNGVTFVETGKTIPAAAALYALGDTGISLSFAVGAYTATTMFWTFAVKKIPTDTYTNPDNVKADFTGGPLVESSCATLDDEGGSLIVVPIYPSTPGSSSAVTQTGSGPLVTLTGAANDDRKVKLKIVDAGARGVATFAYSLDNGLTYSGSIATAATYAIPGTGVTANFATGSSYVAGTTYEWIDYAPQFSTSDIVASFAALKRSGKLFKMVEVVGMAGGADDAAKASACAAMMAAVDTQMVTLFNAHQDARALVHAPSVSPAALKTAFFGLLTTRTGVAAGMIDVISAVSGRTEFRSSGFAIGTMLHGAELSVDISCPDPAETGAGPMPSRVRKIYYDEHIDQQLLDDARFMVTRTWMGKSGFFVSNPNMFTDTTSDYSSWPNGVVIDECSRQGYAALSIYSSKRVRTNSNGTIEETNARSIEKDIRKKIKDALAGDIVECFVKIDRTNNLLGTKTMKVDIRVRPFGYPKTITVTLGFERVLVA